ncbi:MAG TPA: UDP-3-O-(3-hydroxymyristoyl)glucosamine N-acyltransferase [Micropepsaceae bacterium]|nr:UDP-3-O-(3-hydroxymyristoyl)glucosamine N-acyltransferase [Micropepsaceae bacterium]
MADPRFYDNRGPFCLTELCAHAGLVCPQGADGEALIYDVAGLAQAGSPHLAFYAGPRSKPDFLATKAGWCLVGGKLREITPESTVPIVAESVARAFAAIARRFYPEHELAIRAQDAAVHPSARIGQDVVLAPGVLIGPAAEIADGAHIGAYSVIGRGVTIGRRVEIGAHTTIMFAHLGDDVLIQAGAQIGGSGFGYSSGVDGHIKVPHLGRVIVQDRVEIGANSAVDRGALGDTVIGEGTKIDNLVQIGHNTITGRHCILAGQSGTSGSVLLGDFVIVGGGVGIADHVTIGDRARLAGLSGVAHDLDGGRDYGGIPARPIREWHKEGALIAKLARKGGRSKNG